MLQASAFLPQQKWLLPREDDDGNPLQPEIPGAEDVWVRIVPPSWEDDNKRQQFIATLAKDEDATGLELVHYELWLTYGGTNLVALVGKRDPESGRPIWEKDKDGNWIPVGEEVEFDEAGRLSKEEFDERIYKLPSRIIELWYGRVLEVVPAWGERFRRA